MVYRINEIYAGLEGEGHNPGTPTVRVRFQGCSQRCKIRALCDQKEALKLNTGRQMTLDGVLEEATSFPGYQWISLSGGEPLEQNIEPLIWALQEKGKKVRVETSGLPRRIEGPVDYIRVSPKEETPERTKQDWGLELSVVYTGCEDLKKWGVWGNFAMRTLQPLTYADGSTNTSQVMELCQQMPIWQLSVQLHKYLQIR